MRTRSLSATITGCTDGAEISEGQVGAYAAGGAGDKSRALGKIVDTPLEVDLPIGVGTGNTGVCTIKEIVAVGDHNIVLGVVPNANNYQAVSSGGVTQDTNSPKAMGIR